MSKQPSFIWRITGVVPKAGQPNPMTVHETLQRAFADPIEATKAARYLLLKFPEMIEVRIFRQETPEASNQSKEGQP